MGRVIVCWAVILMMAAFTILYIANTVLYLTPPNPVKVRLLPLVFAIEHPLFVQNWHLFAPDPIRSNFVLAVRCRTGDRITPWRDATKPMLARLHQDRNSPMSRLLRIQQNAIRLAFGWTSDEWLRLLCRRETRHARCRGEDPETARQQEIGFVLLRRSGSLACDEVVGAGRATAVQLTVLVHQPPPWSKRHLPDEGGSTRSIVFPWMRYQPLIAHEDRGRGADPKIRGVTGR